MAAKKSTPSNPAAGRRPLDSIDSLRPSSLPPELGSIDMSWDDDPASMSDLGLLTDSEFNLDPDADDRPTAIPSIPMDQLVKASMDAAEKKERRDAHEISSRSKTPSVPVNQAALRKSVPPPAVSTSSSAPPTIPNLSAMKQDETPTVDYRTRATGTRSGAGATQPAPARTLEEFGSPFEYVERPNVAAASAQPTPQSPVLGNGFGRSGPSSGQPRGAISSRPPVSPRLRPSSAPPAAASQRHSRQVSSPLAAPGSARVQGRFTEAPPTARSEFDGYRQQMKDRYATGDFSGALQIAEALLAEDSGDLEAQRYSTSCRDVLTQMLLSRIGSVNAIVKVALSQEELRWLTLDHRAGFLLSLVDGALSVEELLDIAGMPKLESLRILANLLEQRVILLLPS